MDGQLQGGVLLEICLCVPRSGRCRNDPLASLLWGTAALAESSRTNASFFLVPPRAQLFVDDNPQHPSTTTTTATMQPEAALSPLPKADGSATYSYGGYSVTASANGPIEAQRRDENPYEALVDIVVRPASGVGGALLLWPSLLCIPS